MKTILLITVICLVLSLSLGFGQVTNFENQELNTNGYLKADSAESMAILLLDSLHLSSLLEVFIENNSGVYDSNLSHRKFEIGTEVHDGIRFESDSITESIGTDGVIKLVEKGVLNVDTPLYKIVKYFTYLINGTFL